MAKADVASAFRDARKAPDHAQKICFVLGNVLVASSSTFGWSASPELWESWSRRRSSHTKTPTLRMQHSSWTKESE